MEDLADGAIREKLRWAMFDPERLRPGETRQMLTERAAAAFAKLALPLDRDGIELALKAAVLDWSEIDPSIFGTLFERGLDPDKRSQLGAHYTDRDKIMRIARST